METKMFEVRDKATFMPVVCTRMKAPFVSETGVHSFTQRQIARSERYLLRRLGFPEEDPLVLMTVLAAGDTESDPAAWGDRTRFTAHDYIQQHWGELASGAVIDVEFILGESTAPKFSEQESPRRVAGWDGLG